MRRSSTRRWDSLEPWSPTLFLVAGPLVLVVLTVELIRWLTGVTIPEVAYWPLFPLGMGLSLVGLIGLYPSLVGRARRLALTGLALGLLGVVALLGGTAVLVVTAPPGPYPGNLGVPGIAFLLGLLVFVPAFGLYGVAALRTGTPSRRIGALLLVVSLVQFVELLGALFVFPSADGAIAYSASYLLFETVTYGTIVTAMITVGYTLGREAAPNEFNDPVSAADSLADAR